MNTLPKRVLVLGSGALKIGEAGEFDYSGSQAIKALREEGIETILVNPNIATVQTSRGFADAVYFLPVDPHFVEKVIERERPDAIALSFGGQTALNCGLALAESGVLEKYGVRVLGTPIEAIADTEDRQRFVERMDEIGVKTSRARACVTGDEVREAVALIGLPVILRAGFALGGQGSRICETEAELEEALDTLFSNGIRQVLVEESLRGWKELEYEVVRDERDNCITVCNMENVDPLGIHTGESVVVAPTQTLDDHQVQMLRRIALQTIRHLGIVGECNIQYALDPESDDYRVIEVNARLSRSSALASKATGYPLAYVAAKLALGYALDELPNRITGTTSAFFEPALDYVVCKVPRWDLDRFGRVDQRIGSQMKSVGEVMSIGRSFGEAIQKALRMVDVGADGLDPAAFAEDDVERELREPSPRRLFAIARALVDGVDVERLHALTRIDRWFLHEMEQVTDVRRRLASGDEPGPALLREAKEQGFSDAAIAKLTGRTEEEARALRLRHGIRPYLRRIDTLAAEHPASTNYLYLTYHAAQDDIGPPERDMVMVLGSGAYRIGSSVEFDWCAVRAVETAKEAGYETLVLNCNPETVSTDYDVADRLVFDEVTLETVRDIAELQPPWGIVVSMGGQRPNELAPKLHRHGLPVIGTSPESIDRAEDRSKFSALLDELGIRQPAWCAVTGTAEVDEAVASIGGYPVVVRPSYVLSGAAMRVVREPGSLHDLLRRATRASPDHPVVISKFEEDSKEIEIDAVAEDGRVVHWAISEHVENAGVHSGDATLVLPPQRLYIETIRKIRRVAVDIAQALRITGPFNVQFLARNNAIKVIECNLRVSRSVPFVSKVLGVDFARDATRRMLGLSGEEPVSPLDLDYVGVKAAQFSFSRLTAADPSLGLEMSSTGEVGCLGRDFEEALLKALIATGFKLPRKGVLLSLGPERQKSRFLQEARALLDLGLRLYATEGTFATLSRYGIPVEPAFKVPGAGDPFAPDLLDRGEVDLVINIARAWDEEGRPDGYRIRRRAVDRGIGLITNLQLARAVVGAVTSHGLEDLRCEPWEEYLER